MQKVKTMFIILAVVIFSSIIIPLSFAYADSLPPPSYFYFYVTNTDSDVKCVDILIKMDKNSKFYTDLNTSNVTACHFNSSTPIVAYGQDGYVSISFHCKNIHSDIRYQRPDPKYGIQGGINIENSTNPISTITDSIKIALLDKDGNVLKVSDAVSVVSTVKDTFPRHVKYDAKTKTLNVEFDHYYNENSVSHKGKPAKTVYISGFLILAFLIRMAISTAIETFIAIPFKIKPLLKIIIVNIVTQILLFALVEFSGWGYTGSVIVGEIFVFISEFVAYMLLFKDISKTKLALYTLVANTASLAVGLIFNVFHIFVG